MKFKKSLIFLFVLCVSCASFARVITFYNKSVDKINVGYKICTWVYDENLHYNVADCPDSITYLESPIEKNGTYTFDPLDDTKTVYVYIVDATIPKDTTTSFTWKFPTYETYGGAQVTECNTEYNDGLTFMAYNDSSKISCILTN